jgi:hypothetical protein
MNDTDKEVKLEKLRGQLYRAERERDAKKGKPEYKMACMMVEGFQKEIAKLEASEDN